MTTSEFKDRAIPFVAVVTGALLVLLIAVLTNEKDADIQAALTQYQKLPALEREELRSRQTTVFATMPATERRQMEDIHREISKDDELQGKLDRFYEWWRGLDSVARSELLALKEESDDQWIKAVQERYHNDMIVQDEIVANLRHLTFDRHRDDLHIAFNLARYVDFLNKAFPVSQLPQPRQDELKLLTRENDRLLARSLLLNTAMIRDSGPPDRHEPEDQTQAADITVDRQAVLDAVLESLVDSQHHKRMPEVLREAEQKFRYMFRREDRSGGGNAEERQAKDKAAKRAAQAMFVGSFLAPSIDHLGDDFKAFHMPANTELAVVFDNLSIKDQQEMMREDASDARQRLMEQAIIRSDQSGPAVVELARELNRFQDKMRWLRSGGRSDGGPRPARPGGPEFGGRDPSARDRNGGRPPNRDDRDRNGDRGREARARDDNR